MRRVCWLTEPTLAVLIRHLKHLFEGRGKCRTPAIQPYLCSIKRAFDRTPVPIRRETVMTPNPAAIPALRLTRRGRIALVSLLVLTAVLIGLAAAGGAAATGTGVPTHVYKQNLSKVVVRPGDSLWSVAARAEPNADPRLVIQQITDLNALPGPCPMMGRWGWPVPQCRRACPALRASRSRCLRRTLHLCGPGGSALRARPGCRSVNHNI